MNNLDTIIALLEGITYLMKGIKKISGVTGKNKTVDPHGLTNKIKSNENEIRINHQSHQ